MSKEYDFKHIGLQRSYFSDLYFFLLKSSWPKLFVFLALAFVLSNTLFAALYLLGGDCINAEDPSSFVEAFSFSVQTMSTIGYGGMAPTTHYAHLLITIEAFTGMVTIAMASGLMFAKFSRPRARIAFSKNILINQRNGERTLEFRVSNRRESKIVEAHIAVYAIKSIVSKEGQELKRPIKLKMQVDHSPIFALSWLLVHSLDDASPIKDLSLEEMRAKNERIIVSCYGLEENLAQNVSAQHVYHPEDLLFNARFKDMHQHIGDSTIQIDHSKLDDWEALS